MRHSISLLVSLSLAAAFPGAVQGKSAEQQARAPSTLSNMVIKRVPLPGEGRGDYLFADSAGGRLFVTHGKKLHILNLATLQPLAQVNDLGAAHGVAIDRSGRAFVTDGNSDDIIEFDPSTGQQIKRIAVGKKPDGILFDPASSTIWVFDAGSEDVSIIDPDAGVVIKSIKLPYAPEYSQTDGHGHVYVNLEDGNSIAVIDAHKMALDHLIKLGGCRGPAPLAFDPTNRRLFSGCGNRVMVVVDADSGRLVASVPIGGGPDGIAFDPVTRRVVVANRDGHWTIIRQDAANSYRVEQSLKIDEYAKTVAIDPATHRLFSSTADLIWPAKGPGLSSMPAARSGTFRLLVVSQR